MVSEPGGHCLARLSGQYIPGIYSSSSPLSPTLRTRVVDVHHHAWLFAESGDPNSGCHAYMAGILPTEIPSQPHYGSFLYQPPRVACEFSILEEYLFIGLLWLRQLGN